MVERQNGHEFGKIIPTWYRVWYIKETHLPDGAETYNPRELFVYAVGESDALRQTKRWKRWEGIQHKHVEQLDHEQIQLLIEELNNKNGLFHRSLEHAMLHGIAGEAVHTNPDKSYSKIRLSEVIRAKIQVNNAQGVDFL